MKNDLKSKDEIISTMQENLKNLAAFKGEVPQTEKHQIAHFRDFSLSEKPVAPDEADKILESFI
jgi:hypothetical protein